MSTHTVIRGLYIYSSENKRQEAWEKLESKGYGEEYIHRGTETIDGDEKPSILVQPKEYRNLARHVTDLFDPAEQYIHLAWTWNHGHLQIYTEEEHRNFDRDEWVENHPDLKPRPKYRDDPPEHANTMDWRLEAREVFFGSGTYSEYTDLEIP